MSDIPAGGRGLSAKLTRASGSKAILYFSVYLPANSHVDINYSAKSLNHDGDIAARHYGASTMYLQDDLSTWSSEQDWSCYKTAGAADNMWHQRSLSFTADNYSGVYVIYFSSANMVDNDVSYINFASASFEWSPYSGDVYKIGTGYDPKRIILNLNGEWIPALNGADFGHDKDHLDDHEWVYDSGFVYFRDNSGSPASSGISMEISVSETRECGILIDGKDYVNIDNFSVVGWPDYPYFDLVQSHISGMAINNSSHIDVKNCLASGNYRSGIVAKSSNAITFSNNTSSYNGGNGITFITETFNSISKNNISIYNGYWGDPTADGEGMAGGATAHDNIYEYNIVHHNNAHPEGNSVAFVLWNSDNNIARYNQIYSNYHGGAVVYGSNNQFYNNIIYDNGIDNEHGKYNLTFGDNTDTAQGGSRIYNNVLYGGSSNISWIGNLFINHQCTDFEFKNNIIWGFENIGFDDRQVWFDGGEILAGSVFSNNIIGPESPRIFSWIDGKNYASLESFRAASGQELNSLSFDPLVISGDDDNFALQNISPGIDAGTATELTSDLLGNPIYGIPDIGAIEYQPPYSMGSDKPDIAANARVYGDGKFRNKNNPSGAPANLSAIPASGDTTKWMDLAITTWNASEDYKKKWTEESSNLESTAVSHAIGDLKPNTNYDVQVNNVKGQGITGCANGTCLADAQGKITFNYTGGYSTNTFEITEGEAPANPDPIPEDPDPIPEIPIPIPDPIPEIPIPIPDPVPENPIPEPANPEELEAFEPEPETPESNPEPAISPDPESAPEPSPYPEEEAIILPPEIHIINPEIAIPQEQEETPSKEIPKIKNKPKIILKDSNKTIELSVSASDNKGEENLIYLWQVLNGPADAIFQNNNSNQSKSTSANLIAPGDYTFQIIIKDKDNNIASRKIDINISRIISDIKIISSDKSSFSTPVIISGTSFQLKTILKDQFGYSIKESSDNPIKWKTYPDNISIDNSGTISSSQKGIYIIEAETSGNLKDQKEILILSPIQPNQSLFSETLRRFAGRIYSMGELIWGNRAR